MSALVHTLKNLFKAHVTAPLIRSLVTCLIKLIMSAQACVMVCI